MIQNICQFSSDVCKPQLWFPFGNYFLYSDDELSQWFPDGQYDHCLESKHSSRYAWLSELMEANIMSSGPFNLRAIRIDERIKGPRGFGYGRHIWDLPAPLRSICSDTGIEFTGWLRKPKVQGDGLN